MKKYRCYTDTVIGRLLIGNNLYLEAADKDGNSTYCRFDANGLQILNSSFSVCNSLGNSGQANFDDDGFFVKPKDGVLVRGTNDGTAYEVIINPNAHTDEPEETKKIFNICSVTSDGKLLKDYLYFDIAPTLPVLYVNGVVRLQQLYIRDSDVEDIINSAKTENKDKIRGEIICGNGIKSIDNDGNTTFEVKPNGDVTANNAHFEGSIFANGEIEGSVIKGAKIFAGDDYTEQDIIDALPGTINGVTMEGSTIYSTEIFGISQKEFLKINDTSKVVYPTLSNMSFRLMSGLSQKFGVALGNDEDQTVYLNLGHGTGATTEVNKDMVYGEDSLMIQKEADVAKIYIVGKNCEIALREDENIKMSAQNDITIEGNSVNLKGTAVNLEGKTINLTGEEIFLNKQDLIDTLNSLQRKCNSLERRIEILENSDTE